MLTRRTALSLAVLLPLAGCGAPAATSPTAGVTPATPGATPAGKGVLVFAPGALAAHTKKLAEAFRATGREITFEVGHTPMQREQLAKGATPDVWIAASDADMATAANAGLVDAKGLKKLGITKLVVIVPPGNPGEIHEFADIAKPGKKLLLGAESLPIGVATGSTLTKADAALGGGFKAKVEANTVSRELGVSLIVTKVSRREADAGIVFITDVPVEVQGLATIAVPQEVNTPVALSVAPVTAGKDKAGGAAFIEWLTAGPGRELLATAGYLTPTE